MVGYMIKVLRYSHTARYIVAAGRESQILYMLQALELMAVSAEDPFWWTVS